MDQKVGKVQGMDGSGTAVHGKGKCNFMWMQCPKTWGRKDARSDAMCFGEESNGWKGENHTINQTRWEYHVINGMHTGRQGSHRQAPPWGLGARLHLPSAFLRGDLDGKAAAYEENNDKPDLTSLNLQLV